MYASDNVRVKKKDFFFVITVVTVSMSYQYSKSLSKCPRFILFADFLETLL